MPLSLEDLIDERLTPRLSYLQKLYANNLLCKHISSTQVEFPYKNWLSSPAPIFRKNGAIFTPDSYDGDTGIIVYSALAAGDDITADIMFKYFPTTTLENFYKLALAKLNSAPPKSGFTFDDTSIGTTVNYPVHAEDYLTMYAYKVCLETILVDLMNWNAHFLWKDPITLAGILQGIIAGLEASLTSQLTTIKGRAYLMPHSVSAGRWKTPQTVSDNTWQQFTVIRA